MEKKMYGTVLLKANKILDCLADGKSRLVQEIAQETDITAPTVSKILTTLQYINYVSRTAFTKEYYLGSKIIGYGNINTGATSLIETTRSYLNQLQSDVNETIHLSVPENDRFVYVRKIIPKNPSIYLSSEVGLARPLYCSGMGKAILSSCSDRWIEGYLNRTKLKPYTDHTITTPKELKDNIKIIREKGYATDIEEQENDCCCIATSLTKEDRIISALSVSLPKEKLTPEYSQFIINKVLTTKKEIEIVL